MHRYRRMIFSFININTDVSHAQYAHCTFAQNNNARRKMITIIFISDQTKKLSENCYWHTASVCCNTQYNRVNHFTSVLCHVAVARSRLESPK